MVAADVENAVGEAFANAVEHGGTGGSLHIIARIRDDGVEVLIHDDGLGFRPGPRPVRPPDAGAPRGYGIYLMYALTDSIEFSDDGTQIRMFKAFRRSV
jgi:anti-sigma regulatory factor (Ser/Thr protein kinase)